MNERVKVKMMLSMFHRSRSQWSTLKKDHSTLSGVLVCYYIVVNVFMVTLWNRADHYIFMLWFVLLFFSSPNLSHHRLDVCHTSTHGVALVRI